MWIRRTHPLAPAIVATATYVALASVALGASDAATHEKACALGDANACTQLGIAYESSSGHPADAKRAAALYAQACTGKDPLGCARLARMLANGSGVTLDLARAATLYKQACDKGDEHACANLGDHYEHGKGVGRDAVQAAALYQKACTAKDRLGCSGLANLYRTGTGVRKDPARAAALYRHECDAGSAYDCAHLAELYAEGSGVSKDPARAAALYKQACDGGSSYACADLAVMLGQGAGVPKDEQRAAALHRKACDDGVATACRRLASWRFQELRLVAIVPDSPGYLAYAMNSNDVLWPIGAGDRLLDGTIVSVTVDSVVFRKDTGAKETRPLFAQAPPAPLTFDAQYTGDKLSIDLDADITALVAIVAGTSKLNAIVDARSSAKVRIAARDAPWDGLMARALADAGFAYRREDTIVAIAQRDRLAAFATPKPAKWTGQLVSLAIRHGDMRDVGRLFADIGKIVVNLPAAPCESVTLYFNEVPWDQAFAWIVASCGWTSRADAKTIRVELPAGRQ